MIVRDKIFLRKRRDFGDMFGTVFALIRKNFGVLVGSVLLVAGPFIILTAVVTAILQATVLSSLKDFGNALFRGDFTQWLSDILANYSGWFLLLYLFILLSYSFLRTTVANFFVIYDGKVEGESFTINEIARKTYKDVWIVLAGTLVFILVSLIPLLIIMLPFFALSMAGAGGVIFGIFLLFLCMAAFGPQLVYIFQFAPPLVMVKDKVFIFSALGNIFRTIKGNFWWTWVLMICMFFIVIILSIIVNLPVTIYQQASSFSRTSVEDVVNAYSSPVYIALYSFSLLLSNIISILGDLMVGVSYYSFEEEKTGLGLSMKIDEIGRAEENPNY